MENKSKKQKAKMPVIEKSKGGRKKLEPKDKKHMVQLLIVGKQIEKWGDPISPKIKQKDLGNTKRKIYEAIKKLNKIKIP